jgi:hypothetical protein
MSHGQIKTFVESACWPDDVKKWGLYGLDNWHYIDLPIVVNGTAHNYTDTPFDALAVLVTINPVNT